MWVIPTRHKPPPPFGDPNNRCTPPHMVPPPTRSPPNPRCLTNLQMDFQSLTPSFFARKDSPERVSPQYVWSLLEWNFLSHCVYLLRDKGIDSSSSSRNKHKRIKRRKSYTIKHRKNCKEISKQNNYNFQGRKKFFPKEKSVHTPTPLPLNSKIKSLVPKQNRLGNNNNF